ncbi:MAG: adenylosuccinate lyase family protein [Chloroflexi bacterium]|nr:adenylosuccinate lyase family protein [Chloroflexota bacterium]
MPSNILDSQIYGSAWGTDEIRAIFDDAPRTQTWLEIIAALALAQAELDIIPKAAAAEIASKANVELLDLNNIRRGYQQTSHSTLGLIRELQRVLSPEAGEWVYFGATVQDITDTWTVLALQRVGEIMYRDLRALEAALLDHAVRHRDTIMPGRTHGQIGLPITFGFKCAVWASEVRRHIQRLKELAPRLYVGQLAGAVGSVSSYGDKGLELQAGFCARLQLKPPDISWDTARDTIAEFGNLAALVSATLAKLGTEIYNLQRPEILEVTEPFEAGRVGSITMPHKRNPEYSEQIVTLARVIRYNAALLTEGMLHEHERDARSWKAEWHVIPETCLCLGKALALTRAMIEGLVVNAERMRQNLDATQGYVLSEAVMLALAQKMGKQTAHQIVYDAAMRGVEQGLTFKQALRAEERIAPHLTESEIDALLDYRAHLGMIPEMVARVVEGKPENNV